ncbi:hypothetical protein S83_065833, partial [Arachis hypogaea]
NLSFFHFPTQLHNQNVLLKKLTSGARVAPFSLAEAHSLLLSMKEKFLCLA